MSKTGQGGKNQWATRLHGRGLLKKHGKLIDMLTYMRPHLSYTEEQFIDTYIRPYNHRVDSFGNYVIEVLKADGGHSSMAFTAHTDTVHKVEGKQQLVLAGDLVYVDTKKSPDATCLGSDDTTGIYILLSMIDARIPGTYFFFRGEERGGLGSSYMSKHLSIFLDYSLDLRKMVSFDRKGDGDVITHQSYGRCCSNEFARSLAADLSEGQYLEYIPDDSGIYTDSAEFVDLIDECTNLSVGYYHEHTNTEMQDLFHLDGLLTQILKIDWEALPIGNKEKDEKDDPFYGDGWGNYQDYPQQKTSANDYDGRMLELLWERYPQIYDEMDNAVLQEMR